MKLRTVGPHKSCILWAFHHKSCIVRKVLNYEIPLPLPSHRNMTQICLSKDSSYSQVSHSVATNISEDIPCLFFQTSSGCLQFTPGHLLFHCWAMPWYLRIPRAPVWQYHFLWNVMCIYYVCFKALKHIIIYTCRHYIFLAILILLYYSNTTA